MKKITFILLALISGTAFAQSEDSATATVEAQIVSPINIVSGGVLNFGRIASTETGGTATLTPDGDITFSTTDMPVAGGTISTPTFTVTAQYAYQVVIPESVEIENLAKTQKMTLGKFKTGLPSRNGLTASSFNLGGTLEIGPKQAAGDYKGEVIVTVSYE